MPSTMRLSYILGWIFAAIAVLDKALVALGVQAVDRMPVSPRGILFFAGFLFLATIASAAYEQAQGPTTKNRGAAA